MAALVGFGVFIAFNAHTYGGPQSLNAGIVVNGVGYEWRGTPGWFIEDNGGL